MDFLEDFSTLSIVTNSSTHKSSVRVFLSGRGTSHTTRVCVDRAKTGRNPSATSYHELPLLAEDLTLLSYSTASFSARSFPAFLLPREWVSFQANCTVIPLKDNFKRQWNDSPINRPEKKKHRLHKISKKHRTKVSNQDYWKNGWWDTIFSMHPSPSH